MIIRARTGEVLLPTRAALQTWGMTIATLLEDSSELRSEQADWFNVYRGDPTPENPALFKARGKFIESSVLLGTAAEYLLKGTLIKHGFIVNRNAPTGRVLPNATLQQLQRLDITETEMKTISESIERQFKLNERTFDFTSCVNMFQSHIAGANYFDKLTPDSYTVSNPETTHSFGSVVDLTNAFSKVEILRNNYAHVAQAMYEERGLTTFLFNFVLYVAQQEFPSYCGGIARLS
jgi:hypothetical protein